MSRVRRVGGGFAAGVAALAFQGCESTQDTSSRLAQKAGEVQREKGVSIGETNRNVKVGDVDVITDENGSAVVVELRNTSQKPQADVPVLIDVRDAGDNSVYRNDAPGLQRSLTHALLLPPRSDFAWVNDQVSSSAAPKRVTARVGPAGDSADVVDLPVSEVRLERDPASGVLATGVVTNPTSRDLRGALVSVVARRDGQLVAAGRGVIVRARPRKRARFRVFFIGRPQGASLRVTAQAGGERSDGA